MFMTITRDYGELSQDLAGQIFNVQDLGVVNGSCKTLQESKTFGLFANLGAIKLQFS